MPKDDDVLIKINRPTAALLLVLLAPIILPIRLFRWVTGTGKKPVYTSTTSGRSNCVRG